MPICSLLTLVLIVLVLLFLAAMGLVIGQMIWSALCVGVVHLVRPAGKRANWIAALLPVFPPVYVIGLLVLVWWQWPDKEDAYYAAFGQRPGTTVTMHQGNVEGFGDWESIELYFTATPRDIQQITGQVLVLDPQFATRMHLSNPPIYNGVALNGKDVYTGGSYNQRFSTVDDATLVFDPATGEAWYWYEGID